MWGSPAPPHISQILKKKMDKKLYFDPEMTVVDLNLKTTILVGSTGDINDDDNSSVPSPEPGGDDDF